MPEAIKLQIGSSHRIYVTTQDATGLVTQDAPTYEVVRNSDGSVVESGVLSLIAGKTGEWERVVVFSQGMGYVSGEWYSIRTKATVNGNEWANEEITVYVQAESIAPTPTPTYVSGVGKTVKERLLDRINRETAIIDAMDTATSGMLSAGAIIEFTVAGKTVKYQNYQTMESDRAMRERRLEADTSRYNNLSQ